MAVPSVQLCALVRFGSGAQAELQQISQSMLQGVQNKDVGPAGESLRDIVATIRGFDVAELDPNRKRSLWDRLTGRAKPLAKFTERFRDVQGQIDRITDELLRHEHALMKDIESLDVLYDKTLAFYDELALYIAAGEARLAEIDKWQTDQRWTGASRDSESEWVSPTDQAKRVEL